MPRERARRPSRRAAESAALLERSALDELDRIRAPLMEELERLARAPDYYRGKAADLCCRREHNRMRISPLEARAIARAFRQDRDLRRRLPGVLERLRRELRGLKENEERQNFDCPLLERGRCLVHRLAKPIGCAAWHPPAPGAEVSYTKRGWKAFRERDRLNDRRCGPDWKLRAIPLWLKRVFAHELKETSNGKPKEKPKEARAGNRPRRTVGGDTRRGASSRGAGRRKRRGAGS